MKNDTDLVRIAKNAMSNTLDKSINARKLFQSFSKLGKMGEAVLDSPHLLTEEVEQELSNLMLEAHPIYDLAVFIKELHLRIKK